MNVFPRTTWHTRPLTAAEKRTHISAKKAMVLCTDFFEVETGNASGIEPKIEVLFVDGIVEARKIAAEGNYKTL